MLVSLKANFESVFVWATEHEFPVSDSVFSSVDLSLDPWRLKNFLRARD